MKSSLHRLGPFALVVSFAFAHAACGGPDSGERAASSGEAVVEEVADEGEGLDAEPDELLGADAEAMVADDEIDRAAGRPDAEQVAEALREVDEEEALDARATLAGSAPLTPDAPVSPVSPVSPAPPRCHKRIHVTFAVYTYLSEKLGSNGCWVADRTVQDDTFRDCHSDGSIKHPNGNKWFYDDTNPRNDLGRERDALRRCSTGTARGYEDMAFRDGRWRLVGRPHTRAYFAELYTDDAHMDDLYYAPGVYRGNATLRRHRRVAPMLNFAPYPDTYSQRQIATEIVKVCKTLHNHGFLGLYEWHYPLPADSPRLRTVARALNACTKKR